MTTLMALLPVAISALIGAIVGFRYARKEREERERGYSTLKLQHELFTRTAR